MDSPALWLSKWARSPRQDRRVIEDGKFVEQGKVHIPEPPPVEEQVEVNTALEVVHEPVEPGTSAGGNVSLDASSEIRGIGDGANSQSNGSDRPTETGTVEDIPNTFVSTPEGPSVSEVSQAELEPLDAVAAHVAGSLTIAKIVEALEPLPGNILTEEQSDALAETLRLPEPTEDDIPF